MKVISCSLVRDFVVYHFQSVAIYSLSTIVHIRVCRIKRVVKFGTLRKSALTVVLLFCVNAPDNFLERGN